MQVRPLDILLGFKAFGLARELKDSDRRVGCALLDHYNKHTRQCDPSLNTLAVLTGMSRRSVIRSVNRLAGQGFFRRARHGGNFHRNSYEPAWDRLRGVETWWCNLRKMNSRRFRTQDLAPSECQPGHVAGDAPVTQTSTINSSEETCSTQAVNNGDASTAATSAKKETTDVRKRLCLTRPLPNETSKPTPPSSIAALDAAERRWTRALQAKFLKIPNAHARVLDAIDRALQDEITLIERDKPGRGIFVLLERLRIKGVI
jgi:hypothetical protein